MEKVTDTEGRKGFYDESTGFIGLDEMQKVTSNGQKGYYHEKSGFVPIDTGIVQPTQPSQPEPSLVDKLGKRVSNIGGEFMHHPSGDYFSIPDPIHVAGQVAGGITDIAGSALKGLYHAVTPNYVQGVIEEGLKEGTPIGTPLRAIGKEIGEVKQYGEKNWPETTKYAGDILNITGAIPTVKGAASLLRGVKEVGKAGINITNNAILQTTTERIAKMPKVAKESLIKSYDQKISNVINEGLSGTIGNKAKSVTQSISEKAKRTQAVESIVKDPEVNFLTESGKVSQIPKTADEVAQAIDIRKNNIWNKDIAPALEATESDVAGYRVPVTSSIESLDKIIKDRTLLGSPVIAQAEKLKIELLKIQETGGFTVGEAQSFISNANTKLKTYLNKVNPELDTDLAMKANVAREMRQHLDNTVMKATGQGIDTAKREYGSLLSIEEDINKLRNKVARLSSNKNIPTYMDMATDWSLLHHGVTLLQGSSPVGLIPGLMMKGVNTYRKYIMNPDNKIAKMFTEAEKYVNRKEMIKKTMIPPERPQITYIRRMPMEDVSGQPSGYTPNIPLPTMKALGYDRATTPINLGMLDESSVKAVKGVANNPAFWTKNKDLTELRLKLKNQKPLIIEEWNTLLQRIMENRMGGKPNPTIPLKESVKSPKEE